MSELLAMTKLEDFATITMGQSPDAAAVNDEEKGLPFLQGCAEFGSRFPQPRVHCSPPLRVAKSGSTLLSVRAPVGTTNRADQDYCIGRGLGAVLARPGIADDAFLHYAIEVNVDFLHRRSQGSTFLAIGSKELSSLPIPSQPITTQRRIAEILSTLDEAIEQTEALIAKHQQIKAGLMHDLFTRGVIPDGHLRPTREQAPDLYKESPLGWIPKEWEVKQLRDLTIKIADRDHTTPEYVDDGVIMVSPTHLFDDEGIDFAACRKIPVRDHLVNRKKTDVESGDLILHRIGAGLGAVRLVTDDMPEFSILHSMALVRPLRSAVSAEYLLWSFRSYPVLLQMDIGTQSIGVPDLGLDKIGSLLFPVAPHGEQTIIANSLRTQTEAGSAERNRLAKLRQQKLGLMHDLLTGHVRLKV